MTTEIEQLRFLSEDNVRALMAEHGSPIFVYSQAVLAEQADKALALLQSQPYGGAVRYAMKANPHPDVLAYFTQRGIKIDASSGYEADQAIARGVPSHNILLTAQELPGNLTELVESGVEFTATSLHQLETFCSELPGRDVSVRINPGIGSGYNQRMTTGGPKSSFGIWYEYIDEIKQIAKRHNCSITRIHTHIGAGHDPAQWQAALSMTLDVAGEFPDVKTVNIGGGFKVAYMSDGHDTDMTKVGDVMRAALLEFNNQTGRELSIEIEPGRFLVARAGTLIAKVIDKTDTGPQGYTFLRLNTGMNDILRPAMYGAQHPLVVVPSDVNNLAEYEEYVVVGHNCESSDLLTPAAGNPEATMPRSLQRAERGDFMAIEMTGAYCASMAAKNYNSFKDAKEVFLSEDSN